MPFCFVHFFFINICLKNLLLLLFKNNEFNYFIFIFRLTEWSDWSIKNINFNQVNMRISGAESLSSSSKSEAGESIKNNLPINQYFN